MWLSLQKAIQHTNKPSNNNLLVSTVVNFLQNQANILVNSKLEPIENNPVLNAFDSQIHYVKAVKFQSQEDWWQALSHWNKLRYSIDKDLSNRAIQNTVSLLQRLGIQAKAMDILQLSYLTASNHGFKELLFIQLKDQWQKHNFTDKLLQLVSHQFLYQPSVEFLNQLIQLLTEYNKPRLAIVMSLMHPNTKVKNNNIRDIANAFQLNDIFTNNQSELNLNTIQLANRPELQPIVNRLYQKYSNSNIKLAKSVANTKHQLTLKNATMIDYTRDNFLSVTPIFTTNKKKPLQTTIEGPVKLALSVYPEFAHNDKNWISIRHTNKDYVLPINSSKKSNAYLLDFAKGSHTVIFRPKGQNIKIQMKTINTGSNSQDISLSFPINLETINLNKHYSESEFMPLFFNLLYMADNYAEEKLQALSLANTLYNHHQQFTWINKINEHWNSYAMLLDWHTVYPLQHAGVRIDNATPDLSSEKGKLNSIFTKGNDNNAVLLKLEDTRYLQINNANASVLNVDLALLEKTYNNINASKNIIRYQVNDRVRHIELSAKNPIRKLQIPLEQGSYNISLQYISGISDQTIKASFINDQLDRVQPVQLNNKVLYHLATQQKPVIIDVKGPTLLRVERSNLDQQKTDFHFLPKGRHRLKITGMDGAEKTRIRLTKRVLRSEQLNEQQLISRK